MGAETAKDYYVWRPSRSPFTIKLDLAVVDKLHTEIMRGFGAVRRRGTEVGGILLGRIDVGDSDPTVTVEGFEPIACDYAHGPSYILSGEDLQKFRQALGEFDPSAEKPLYTVGFYRSHTRDGLTLDEHDIRFFREYFPDPFHVALLVQPFATKAPVAGFFVQEKGVLKPEPSYLEFPFRRRDLNGSEGEEPERVGHDGRNGARQKAAEVRTSPPPAPEPALVKEAPKLDEQPEVKPRKLERDRAAIEEKPLFAVYDHTPSAWKSRLGWVAMCVMLVVFGFVIGNQYSGAAGTAGAPASTSDPYALNLSASRAEDNLLVTWDPKSPAVTGGWRGILTITEGNVSRNVQMEPPKLQNGSVLYRHIAPEVTFRLEIFVKEHRSVVETMVYHMAPGETVPAVHGDAVTQ